MKQLFLFALLIYSSSMFSQQGIVELNWLEEDSLLYFPKATYIEETNQIPVYTRIIPWIHSDMAPTVKAIIKKSTELTGTYSEQIHSASLGNTPLVRYEIVLEKKKPMLQISVLPFYINPLSGKTERVDAFELEISEMEQFSTLKALKKGSFASSSVMANNDWYKISVKNSGIHKLTYEKLQEIGLQNPARVKLFGAGAVLLPEDYSNGFYDDLSEVPIYMDKGSDQLFGPGDFILFYAHGPVTWSYDNLEDFYSQEVHSYSTNGYYFLSDAPGNAASPVNLPLSGQTADHVVTAYDILKFHEDEKYNLLNSGREWYGDKYKLSLTGAYPFTLKNIVTSESIKIRVTAAARSNESSTLNVKANSTSLGNISFGVVNLSSYTSTYAIEQSETFSYKSSQEIVTVQAEYMQPNSNSEAWLNHISLNGRARLEMFGDELTFRDSRSAGFGNISEFQLKQASTKTIIWDITNPNTPGNIAYNLNGTTATFRLSTDEIREFVAFNTGGTFPSPEINGRGLGKVPNQNLHGTAPSEMLIVYTPEFEEQVMRLAEHRRSHDNLSVQTVTQEMIFNEFSSGTPNVSALRNYLKMYYDMDQESAPDYLLLFGDGSFDNRDTSSNNPNIILTYQSTNSLAPTSSYVSDDFYGLLDTGEKLYDGLLDIGIGRLPVSSIEEAELMVDKIISYDGLETLGEWRNYLCLIGDDEDGNIHMKQANSLANFIESSYPNYNINKIFIDAYPQETTPSGDRYPDVTRAINDQMNRGALIINYTGHGGVTGLAHEKILEITNIKNWRNKGKLPLFMTATCEFSRYDEYSTSNKAEVTSAGEEVMLNPLGGSIALFTTTRLVYSGPNHVLNENFYEIIFEKKANGECHRLGDVIVYSKNNAGAGINKRNFTLLGDPSISLSFPKNIVITDSINHMAIEEQNDTISALDYVTISGHLEDQKGTLLASENGTIIPIVYDKKSNLKTLANDGGSALEFSTRNNILYKGNATVSNGYFSFSFYVPKDIGYKIGEGKISYYSYSEDSDAHGSTSNITIGGLGDFSDIDTTGPAIEVYMNDSLFRNGGIVNSSPELLVYVKDPYGINTTGNGIGHDITATLNEDRINALVLNEYYVSDKDSYSSGSVRYPYSDLPVGKHTIDVKIWDIFNNSSTKSIDFIVVESTQMLLDEIFTYPNPFVDYTNFNIEHNRPGQNLEIIIKIYDIRGNIVSILENEVYAAGFRVDPISWSGKSMGGATLGGGLYVYKIFVRTEEGEEAAGSGRMIIKR